MRPAASQARGVVAALAAAALVSVAADDVAVPPQQPMGMATAASVEAPVAFPARARVRAARHFLARRAGVRSFALIDSRGRVYGYAPRRAYVSASVTKAMLLVAYLRGIGRRPPTAEEKALLGPMITVSDNDRADAVYARVGDAGLLRVARRAHMRHFATAGYWASASITAVDQARFFRRVDRLVPKRNRSYARRLLASIVSYERWGFSRYAARAGYRAFFKGGWRGTASGRLVHEAALFEHGRSRFAMAVLTDGNPTHDYGTETLRGVAARIFGSGRERQAKAAATRAALRRAGLEDVLQRAPGIRVEPAYGTAGNLTGRPLPGYCRPWAYLLGSAARDLAKVQRALRRGGRGLLVLDAYRPARASRALVRWARRSGHPELVGTYIARRSRHNLGSAVDLTLVRLRDGRRLRMGTGYDHLGPRAHTLSARGRALRNRLALKAAMEGHGFGGYWREWWHFEHRLQGAVRLDLTLGVSTRHTRDTRVMSELLRVALAQIDPKVGDIRGNARKIAEYTARARERGASLVVFPELSLTGYPPEDLLLKTGFLDAAAGALDELASQTNGIVAVVGFPQRADDVYNAAAVLADGRVAAVYRKMYLPNYGVFDEQRYFQSGTAAMMFELNGIPIGVSICEDIWEPGPPAMTEALAGAQVLINLSASPYRRGYGARRERMIVQRAVDYQAAVVFVNTVGGQDELVFDGHSVAVSPEGAVLARGAQFEESLAVCSIDPREVVAARLRDTRHRANVRHQRRAQGRAALEITVDHGPSVTVSGAGTGPPAERVGGELATPLGSEEEEVYAALRTGLRDYVEKNGFEKVVLALSGGIDSALVALIAVDALGAERVTCVSMPSPYSSEGTRADARAIAENLGTPFLELSIEEAMQSYSQLLEGPFEGTEPDIAEENLQARIRGNVVMALSNKFGWLVLTTGNKSELSVGYATLYGDMAGGLAVIKDVYKGLVYRLVRWRNETADRELVPLSALERPPSAELRHEQLDEDSLPPYDVLDAILEGYVEEDLDASELVARGLPVEDVERVIAMVDRAEYKRRQAPPGIKISTRAFGRDRRLPITNGYVSTAVPVPERHLRALK